MAVLRYPTSIEIDGPILITWDDASALQVSMVKVLTALNSHRMERFEAEFLRMVEEGKKRHEDRGATVDTAAIEKRAHDALDGGHAYRAPTTNWTVYIGGGRYLEGQSLEEISCQPGVGTERATGLSVTFACGPVWGEVKTAGFATKLNVSVYPSGNNLAEAAFENLRQWAERMRPSTITSVWSNIIGGMWLVWFAASAFGCIGVLSSGGDNGRLELRREAATLLSGGITPQEMARANELTLALAADVYDPRPVPISWGYYPTIVLAEFILCMIYSFPPGFRLAIAPSHDPAARARSVTRWLWISLPAFVVTEGVIAYFINRLS